MINQDRDQAAWTAGIDRIWAAALTLILLILDRSTCSAASSARSKV
jgi:hypothetical protein